MLGTKCKKIEHNSLQKKVTDIQADTHGYEQVGKCFINYYYLTVKVKKNDGTYTVLMSNYVSEVAYEA